MDMCSFSDATLGHVHMSFARKRHCATKNLLQPHERVRFVEQEVTTGCLEILSSLDIAIPLPLSHEMWCAVIIIPCRDAEY